nr:MAG TPA: VIP2 [Caudoviricetes sp.]
MKMLIITMKNGQKEVNKKKKPSILAMALFLALLDQPNYSGFNWKKYIEATIQYNAQQIYKQAILNMQQQKGLEIDSNEFQIIINRQNNQKLNINNDKISGAADLQMIGLNNLAKVEGIKEVTEDNSKVRFIAVEDDKTTLMCNSLNNQEFYINKENVFDRYYGENQKELKLQKIRCKGLVLGLNLPPIQHHFHFCRSTIVYNSNYKSKDFKNGNVLGEEQYKSLKQYLKSMSYKINSKLYNNEKLSEEDREYIQNLDNALKGMPIYKGWVKRCVYVRDSEDVSNILSIFNNEQKIGHWNSYISSALGVYDINFKMIMKIKSKTGRNLSTLNDEGGGEILFMRNTDFQLIDIKNKNGIIYVKLEEL